MRHARLLALSTALSTVLGGALLLSGCGSLFGSEATPPVAAAAPAPSALHAQLLEDVRILAADDMQGRDTGARRRGRELHRRPAGGAGRRRPADGPATALGNAGPDARRAQDL
jgi:hypothetical protein